MKLLIMTRTILVSHTAAPPVVTDDDDDDDKTAEEVASASADEEVEEEAIRVCGPTITAAAEIAVGQVALFT